MATSRFHRCRQTTFTGFTFTPALLPWETCGNLNQEDPNSIPPTTLGVFKFLKKSLQRALQTVFIFASSSSKEKPSLLLSNLWE